MILSDALVLQVSQLPTQQVMTSQIRSHIEYLIQIHHIVVVILLSKLVNKLALIAGFDAI